MQCLCFQEIIFASISSAVSQIYDFTNRGDYAIGSALPKRIAFLLGLFFLGFSCFRFPREKREAPQFDLASILLSMSIFKGDPCDLL